LRYEAPTAASRAKLHNASTSRAHGVDYMIPPTRPSTPSANPAALRLTMPTSSRHKTRPALASVFSPTVAPASHTPLTRSSPPLPSRPPSSLSGKSRSLQAQSVPQPSAPRVLRRPKRQRTYGDGTELDGFDDLPTDGDKEGRYRVQPKGYGNRVPGASYPLKLDKAALRKKNKRDVSGGSIGTCHSDKRCTLCLIRCIPQSQLLWLHQPILSSELGASSFPRRLISLARGRRMFHHPNMV
jgi:hypothetical protein